MNTSPRSAIAYLATLDNYDLEHYSDHVVLLKSVYGYKTPYSSLEYYWKEITKYYFK
jgi:hypothetical protein